MASYDIIGSGNKAVAIVEIPREEQKNKLKFAEEIMKANKIVKSVLEKSSARKGKFRKLDLKLIAGDKDTEVLHREFGYILKLDPRKVYFSPRESTERQKISSQVKPGETVLVMFGGIAAMPVAIAKKRAVLKIFSVEINPDAHKYALENARVNKLSHKIVPILGNVKESCKEFYGKCDRVAMPLPLGADKFLDIAVKCVKAEGGIVHFYSVGGEDDLFSRALVTIDEKLKKLKKSYVVMNKRKVLPYSPRKFKIVLDVLIK